MERSKKCHDCNAELGAYHETGCFQERCPFCGGQMVSCGCVYKHLGLVDEDAWGSEIGYIPPEIYHNGLSKKQWAEFDVILAEIGRRPHINWPNYCRKCGCLWPVMFKVPDEAWQHYVDPLERGEQLCLECFGMIVFVVDRLAKPFVGKIEVSPIPFGSTVFSEKIPPSIIHHNHGVEDKESG